MSKINLFLVGAQKSSTTSLYDWLGQHDDVSAPGVVKDFHFFTLENLYSKGNDFLESFYLNDKKVLLHSAVNYLYFSELSAKRIFEYNSDAKIVICLRNPVERAISAYKYFFRTLREDRPFSVALKDELMEHFPLSNSLSDHTYIGHGNYSNQIKNYLKYFPVNQIFFIVHEELLDFNKRETIIKSLFDFVGLPNNIDIDFRHLNSSSIPKYRFLNNILRGGSLGFVKKLLPFKTRKFLLKEIEQFNLSTRKIQIPISEFDKDILFSNLENEPNFTGKLINKDLTQLWY